MHFAIGHIVLLHSIQTTHVSYLENLKLFSSRVKELFEPIVLSIKGDGSIFKAFSQETDL